jgi:NADPH:quinone reductase-like Zn-dependent oxidoreductase
MLTAASGGTMEGMDEFLDDAPEEEVPADAGMASSAGAELAVIDAYEVVPAQPQVLPAVQAAAVGAAGFLAGAATLALLHRRDVRRLAREIAELKAMRDAVRRPAPFPLAPGRSYLVHIRVLGQPPHASPPQ